MSYILVVDDEKDIRDLISQILFEEGHTVKLAHNSTSAIDYINNEEPDLIILDICKNFSLIKKSPQMRGF